MAQGQQDRGIMLRPFLASMGEFSLHPKNSQHRSDSTPRASGARRDFCYEEGRGQNLLRGACLLSGFTMP